MTSLHGKLIVSCQADEADPTHGLMAAFARAAVAGGAAGIRASGAADVRSIRAAVSVPILGIDKQVHSDGRILITPTLDGARALVGAGAGAVALDCTRRGQASGAFDRLRAIRRELRVPVLADIATLDEALAAVDAGADYILPTLRGYTVDTSNIRGFEGAFLAELVRRLPVPVIAEGRVDTPELARQAMRAGAWAVVVGTMITRPHSITRRFADAVEREAGRREGAIDVLGIDMGGTNTKSGLVTSTGHLLWHATTPTPAQGGQAALIANLQRVACEGLVRARTGGRSPAAIGIATAGWVDPVAGAIAYSTDNLPGWTGACVAEEVGAASGLPVIVENDANALAVGESAFGAARGLWDFVCITLGTGVGGGCYAGGRLNRGSHFFANALGHICIERGGRLCTCGLRGCLEAYANAAALLSYAGPAYPDCAAVIAAAHAGDATAEGALAEFARRLAAGCAILVNLFDPQALILAGGLAQDNPRLVSSLESELARRVMVWQARRLRIATSMLGYHAGVLGAAAVALDAMGE